MAPLATVSAKAVAAVNRALRCIYVWWLRRRGVKHACRCLTRVSDKLRVDILRGFGAVIGTGSSVRGPLHVMGRIRDFRNLQIGDETYIGPDCLLDLSEPLTIGNRVAVSARCSFVTHLNVGPGALGSLYPPRQAPVLICDDTWLGVGTTVLMGVQIGPRSMVGSGSLVKDDVAPETLVAGVPARAIKDLHSEDFHGRARP